MNRSDDSSRHQLVGRGSLRADAGEQGDQRQSFTETLASRGQRCDSIGRIPVESMMSLPLGASPAANADLRRHG